MKTLELLSIGKMAMLNETTVQTLRFYDKINLLKPYYTDPKTNYRYYSIKQSARLDLIKYLKYMGFSLNEIKDFLNTENLSSIPKMFEQQLTCINQKINELSKIKKAIEVARTNYKRYLQLPRVGHMTLEHLPKRKIFCYDTKKDIYKDNLITFEYLLRMLRKRAASLHIPMSYFCNIGSIVRLDTILQNQFSATEIFIFVDHEYDKPHEIEIIPEHDYLCTYCDCFSKEKQYAFSLFNYAYSTGFRIIGDLLCEVIVDLPVKNDEERQMIMKLQVPVQKN